MSNKTDLYILMLEDDPMDADLNRAQLLLLEEYNCIIDWVTDKESYLKALHTCPDLVLSDYSLPQYNGLEALKDLNDQKLLIPFIFVTGTINEETAADTIKAGAWDYVVKDRLFRLPLAIRSVLKLKKEKVNTLKAEALNRKLSMAVEQSPAHIIITDFNGRIEYVNTRFTEVTGYLPGEVIGKDPRVFIPGEYIDENFSLFWDNLKAGQSWRGEAQSRRKDGTYFWESISISPLKDENGEITHFVTIKEDVTQRKLMEQKIITALDQAERSDKLKEVFLQNLSHEIRTPLNAIVGFSSLLNENDIDAQLQKEYKTIVMQSSQQLLSIVSDILTVSKIQTGQEELIIKPCSVNNIMDSLKVLFQQRVEAKGLAFNLKSGLDDSMPFILTDETKLVQILTNLLNNALKFTHQGFIELGCWIEGESVNFYVKDTGIGIAGEYHESIFERFRQADNSITASYGGTGLGLSISKSFAEMLGGVITVKSRLGHGATFTLSIPYKCAEITYKEKVPEKPPVANKKTTILVAEDEEFNYQLIEAFLAGHGYVLLKARNGKEAIDVCQRHPEISLILMDIKMPEMDGQTALSEIRKFNADVPAIAQTAYSLEHEKQQFLANGFNDYISKPLKREVLLEKIHNLLFIHHEV